MLGEEGENMNKIIKFPKSYENEKPKKSIKAAWIVSILSMIGIICSITGVTLKDIYQQKDWQKIAEGYNNEALELYGSGQYEEAIQLYNKAIMLEDKGIDNIETCYYNRGRAYFKMKNYEKAIIDYTNAIAISPKAKYYTDRAIAYEAIGDTQNAVLDNIKAVTSIVE